MFSAVHPGRAGAVSKRSFARAAGARERTLQVIWRWSSGMPERIPELIADLVRLKVDVIVTEGTIETSAAKNATTEIPIVMASTSDPVGTGLVAASPVRVET